MNLKSTLTIVMLLLVSLCQAQQVCNRALLVGVAHYPKGSGWDTIHSDSDVRLLNDLLSNSFSLKTLVDGQATYGSIIKALEGLAKNTGRGDTVLILFSCHGQQMWQSGETDGLDEALVPYDAKRTYSDTYKGENHLRDDVLANHILKIRKNAGNDGLVVVLLDACHSGDSFRGEEYTRGVYDVFGLDTTPRIKRERRDVAAVMREDRASDVVFISACQSYEINSEYRAHDGKWYGSLAYAFAQSYRKYGLSDMKSLCGAVRSVVHQNSSQYPEFALSDTGLAAELRGIFKAPAEVTANSPCNDERKVDWTVVAIASAASVAALILLIGCYGKRKRK